MNTLSLLFEQPVYWIAAGLALIGLEMLLPGIYVLWIGLGALVTGVALLVFPAIDTAGQLAVFAIAMVGSVLVGVRIQGKRTNDLAAQLNTGLASYIGRAVIAENTFVNNQGRVQVDDSSYMARSDGPVIKGDTVYVVAIDNAVLVVSTSQA